MSFLLSTFVRTRPSPNKPTHELVSQILVDSHNVRVVGGQEDAADATSSASSSSGRPGASEAAASYGPFSGVLGPGTSQDAAYDALTSELVRGFLQSRTNCTIFAYGQTGSGKTYTLFGPPGCFGAESSSGAPSSSSVGDQSFGLCPRAILAIKRAVQNSRGGSSGGGATTTLFVSAVEIYLEECYDLLNNKVKVPIAGFATVAKKVGGSFNNQQLGGAARTADGKWVPPVVNGKRNPALNQVEVRGCKEVDILGGRNCGAGEDDGERQLLHVMRVIEATRSGRSHALNERSSRSHCIVTLTMTRVAEARQTKTQFLFVDLAGSERIKKTDVLGAGAQEARSINLSLSSLGRCVSALQQGGAAGSAFVPWRDSALTMLMKQSLSGGPCRTALCVCIAEDGTWASETVSSLRFGVTCGRLRGAGAGGGRGSRCGAGGAAVAEVESTAVDLGALRAQVAAVDGELQELRARGVHGHVDPSFPRPTADGFVQNFAKLRAAEAGLLAAQLGRQQQQKAACQEQIVGLRGLLIRQITTGLWREPAKAWRLKMEERKALLAELAHLGGGAAPPHVLSSAVEDEMSCLGLHDLTRDFKG